MNAMIKHMRSKKYALNVKFDNRKRIIGILHGKNAKVAKNA